MAVVIGVDVGGTKMLSGIVTTNGEPLAMRQVQTRPDSYMSDLQALVADTIAKAHALGEDVAGIGVGTTGLVDRVEGRMRRSLNLGLSDFPIRSLLEEIFSVPVYVDNDLHAAALGELMFGIGRRFSDFLLVNAGTGVAVGMVLGGRLHRGASNVAGEFGHMSIDYTGPTCSCGLPGCLEFHLLRARHGEPAMTGRFTGPGEPPPSSEYAYLALGIINLVNLLNPVAVVLAGGMFTNNASAASWVADAIRHGALDAAAEGLQHVGLSESGPMLGLIGAAALVLEDLNADPRTDATHA